MKLLFFALFRDRGLGHRQQQRLLSLLVVFRFFLVTSSFSQQLHENKSRMHVPAVMPTSNPKDGNLGVNKNGSHDEATSAARRRRNIITSTLLWNHDNEQTHMALIILNSPIASPPSQLFEALWDGADYIVCADGGANRLYDSTASSGDVTDSEANTYQGNKWIPHEIRGDLDSLRLDVREYYATKQPPTPDDNDGFCCRVVHDPDQDTNDLTKALQAIVSSQKQRMHRDPHNSDATRQCCIFGAFGGRFDQEMAAFHALYAFQDDFDAMWLYDDQNCAVLLAENVIHEIRLQSCRDKSDVENAKATTDSNDRNGDKNDQRRQLSLREGPTCGLIPLSGDVERVTTTGLKWNLTDQPTSFGGLLSTSNHIVGAETENSNYANDSAVVVTVEASGPLVFTAEIMQ